MVSTSIAEELAKKQREISVSEFFERNKQILGYDSPTKALLTAVREAVDNSVEHDEPVLIRENGRVRLVKIGNFIDQRILEARTYPDLNGVHSVPLSDCEVLAYDDSTLKVGFRRASMAHRHPLRGNLYEIKLTGCRKVTVTGSHSVFVLAGKRIVAYRVQDLRVGDYVAVPNREVGVSATAEEVDFRPWLTSLPSNEVRRIMLHGLAERLEGIPRDWKRFDFVPLHYVLDHGLTIPPDVRFTVRFGKSRLPVVLPVTEALMRFLGLYVAEGTRLENTIFLSFGSHEGILVEGVRSLVSQAFGPENRVSVVRAHGSAVCVKVYSTILSWVFRDIFRCGDRAPSKRVPDLVFNVSGQLQTAFLRGYIEGDGHRDHQRITVATVSEELGTGLAYLFALRGKAFSVSTRAARLGAFPQGRTSWCRNVFYLYIYGTEGTGGQPKSPLLWFPLEETGFRDVVHAMRPLNSYNAPAYGHMQSSSHYAISKFSNALVEAEFYARAELPAELHGQRRFLERLILGDIGFLQIRSIRKVESPHPYVYDFSVPGYEKFLGGRGAIFLHNTLDACEEADIPPDVHIEVNKVDKDEFLVAVEDNGPGIVKREVANVFGRLLYGSRFHARRQARGALGLGISGAIMYGQITTGKPATIRTKTSEMDVAYQIELIVDTRKNRPSVQREDFVAWDKPHGTRIEIPLKGRYVTGKQSVLEYIKATAIVNPHARLIFRTPDGEAIVFERATEELPPKALEIRPHPYGIELGTFLAMAKETRSYRLGAFLETEFSRISSRVAREICEKAGVSSDARPKALSLEDAKRILGVIKEVKIMSPPTDCLAPIGERLIRKGLRNVLGNLRPEFYCPPVTREPSVHSGNPFQVEAGIVYGGNLPADQPVEILRFANRVPLLYQPGACACTAAVENVDWRRYGLEQRGGKGIPYGPAIILIHVCSTKIPFTSESKEAIAPIPIIVEEIERALKECGRRLSVHMTKKAMKVKTREKFEIVQKILPKLAEKSAKIIAKNVPDIGATITKIMNVVWIDESSLYQEGRRKVSIDIYNYTPTSKRFKLHAVVPRNCLVLSSMTPQPSEIKEDGKITWELKRIASVEKTQVSFELAGMERDEYDEAELYVSDINPVQVIGAEPLPGDWDLEYLERPEGEAIEAETGEVDYDEVEEVLEDD